MTKMQLPKKILIIRFSSIGDIVLTSPIVRCLKKQVPDAEIHFLVKKQYVILVNNNPYITKIHTFEGNIREIIQVLKKEKFDFVVDLQKNRRSTYIKSCLKVASGTFNKLNKKKWLFTNFKLNLLPKVHVVDRYFRAVKKLNVVNDGQGLDFFIPVEDRIEIKKVLPEKFQRGYIALATGSKQNTKKIPLEKMLELCRAVDKPLVLLGGKEDFDKAKQVQDTMGDQVFNACGGYNINQSASIAKQAEAVISSDTGLMHIAAALRKKVISVWGNTVPDFGMYPYYPQGKENFHVVEVTGLKCRPCSKLGYKKCPKKHFRCMMDIDVQKIAELVK
jgi:heptosyltransferase-2